MVKKLLLVSVAIFCLAGISLATEEGDCKALFELYGKCYQQGDALKSLDKCSAMGDEIYEELKKEGGGAIGEAISNMVATVCDDACRESVDGQKKMSFEEFKAEYCK